MLPTQCSRIFFSYKSFYEIDMLCKVMLTKLELTYFCRGRWGSPGRLLSWRICGGQSMYFPSLPESISTTEQNAFSKQSWKYFRVNFCSAECIFPTSQILWDYAGRPQEDVMLNSKPDLGQYFDSAFEIYLAPLPFIYYL